MKNAVSMLAAVALCGCGIFGDTSTVDLQTDANVSDAAVDGSTTPGDMRSRDGGGPGDGGSDGGGNGTAPCASVEPVDVSSPDAVVGDGTADSCTEEAFDLALQRGGVITFDCGDEPVTITLTSTKRIEADTTIDGGSNVTLSGGGAVRLLHIDTLAAAPSPTLNLQHINLIDGFVGPEEPCGAAILRVGGTLKLVDVVVEGHRCAEAAGNATRRGGAIVVSSGGPTTIAGSVFRDNRAGEAGALRNNRSDVQIIDSQFIANEAETGNGGAIFAQGEEAEWTICGSRFGDNSAADSGGAMFHVGADGDVVTIEHSTFSRNRATGQGGGAYLQGGEAQIRATTFEGNIAEGSGGGLRLQDLDLDVVNTTVANNESGGLGAGLQIRSVTGRVASATIVGNRTPDVTSFAAGIAGGTVTLRNTIVADNSGGNVYENQNCDVTQENLNGNIQWPEQNPAEEDERECAEGILFADPALGELGDHGGLTPTVSVSADSPAVGYGRDCPETDQRGVPRSSPRCTAGAFEAD